MPEQYPSGVTLELMVQDETYRVSLKGADLIHHPDTDEVVFRVNLDDRVAFGLFLWLGDTPLVQESGYFYEEWGW